MGGEDTKEGGTGHDRLGTERGQGRGSRDLGDTLG